MNIVVMKCYFRSKPLEENGVPMKGYRQRMYKEWKERGLFNVSEQRVCDQARTIRKNGWLTELELEELKQRVLAKKAKIDWYTERIQQFRQNRLFNYDQKRLYSELNMNNRVANEIPDAEESRMFWNGIWGVCKDHNYNAEWLTNLKYKNNYRNQEGLVITEENV